MEGIYRKLKYLVIHNPMALTEYTLGNICAVHGVLKDIREYDKCFEVYYSNDHLTTWYKNNISGHEVTTIHDDTKPTPEA